ncbi:MAG: hypothetical protein ACRDEA_17135 [Microcystaceae cyanobacterium]
MLKENALDFSQDTDALLRRLEIEQARTQLAQVNVPQLLETKSQQAALRRAEAELAEAMRERDRFVEYLYKEGGVSQQEFALKQLALRQARENVSRIESMGTIMSRTSLLEPYV